MKVLFAPDWRGGNPYQQLLAEALAKLGVEVSFADITLRRLSLSSAVSESQADILHLHWPDAFYPKIDPRGTFIKKLLFPLDLSLATRNAKYVLTAHNLEPHNRQAEWLVKPLTKLSYRSAKSVFIHSEAAAEVVSQYYSIPRASLHVVAHGDLAAAMPVPASKEDARQRLGIPGGTNICLMFGAIDPYKGIEEAILYWKEQVADCRLVILGKPCSADYAAHINELAKGVPNIDLHLEWADDATLSAWLAAADCTLFNYRTIFASGAACLARSFGVPILFPARAKTVDLGEPSPLVFRFESLDSQFHPLLTQAIQSPGGFAAADMWRAQTSWDAVARATLDVYKANL